MTHLYRKWILSIQFADGLVFSSYTRHPTDSPLKGGELSVGDARLSVSYNYPTSVGAGNIREQKT